MEETVTKISTVDHQFPWCWWLDSLLSLDGLMVDCLCHNRSDPQHFVFPRSMFWEQVVSEVQAKLNLYSKWRYYILDNSKNVPGNYGHKIRLLFFFFSENYHLQKNETLCHSNEKWNFIMRTVHFDCQIWSSLKSNSPILIDRMSSSLTIN